jgi:predicted RNase H-like HicB family nuclease
MRLKVVLYPSDEGYAVSAPSLPGCWSQGATREEALENIADAIREYLDVDLEQPDGVEVREIEVAV